ncbi:putative mediator of RNA polymerase II transcription subunit 26 isoform X2 [Microplitis demolitor]|uniref:putative mediator of RNA polymerase II transcription subunit 26 isoform X2 n=1 Tax=Microplitis demolitor TaxID=69319 RepID=UPI0004CD3922|nr:putative mediator of RNA polymerase II transcription subunit 26 isoform X2 [Microplitis demolitor]
MSSKEEKIAGMVLTVTEDTPADMLAGSMELLVQLPRDHSNHTERVTVERSTAMMDLLVQIATAHKLAASSYTLQAIGERGRILPHQPNTPIGALDALEVKLLPKQGTFIPRKTKQASQPFETTFRLQVHLPRNQLYVSRVSPKTNLGDILSEVCREKNLDKNKYELRHPGNHKEILDLSLSLQDYQLQEVTLYAKQGHRLGSALSSQDIMVLQRQEERRRHQAKQSIFGFMFKKSSKESSTASTESGSYGARSVSPARSDDTGRSISPLVAPMPTRPLRKRRPAPNPPTRQPTTTLTSTTTTEASRENDVVTSSNKKNCDTTEDKLVITHSRNSSDSSGYHEASVLSDNPDSAGRMPETLPRRTRPPSSKLEPRKLAQTSQASKSLCNLAISSGGLSHANSNTSLSSTGIRKKRAAPQPPVSRPLSSAISSLALERIVDSEESLTSDMGVSKPPSDIAASSETETHSKANSDIVVGSNTIKTVGDLNRNKFDDKSKPDLVKTLNDNFKLDHVDTGRKAPIPIEVSVVIEKKSVPAENLPIPEEVKTVEAKTIKRAGLFAPIPKPRSKGPVVPKRISSALSSQSQSVPEVTGASEEREFNLQVSDKESKQKAVELNIKNSERAGDKKEEREEEKNDLSVTLNLAANSSALNSNFSSRSPDMEAGRTKLDIESPWNALSSSKTPNEEQYHPFITTTASNLTLPMENLLHYRNIQEGEPHSQGTGKAGNESPTEIDRLLQKVSTTLASVLPDEEVASRSEIKTTEPEKIHARDLNSSHNNNNNNIDNNNNSNNNNNNNGAGTDLQNSTFNSQQDTSDYVSANGEDLSGTDWEYQLPDPPSAFRDDNTPAADYDGYDTITLRSVEAFKEPIAIDEDTDKNINYDATDRAIESCRKTDRVPDDKLSECSAAGENKKDQEVELRRNVINELESKLESGSFSQGNKVMADDSRKSSIETSTPKVAPIENTLPNFTISTYSRQKSLNIYDSRESTPKFKDPAEDRTIKTFATLSRNINANSISKYNKESSPGFVSSQVKDEFKTPTKIESKITPEAEEKIKAADSPPESTNTSVHRSKSYIVLTNNSKYRENKISDEVDTCSMIKSTSVTNLNKDNTWTDSNNAKILNENLQERELQSVQVLKSILPQLKSTQSSQGDKEDEDKVEVMKNDKSGQFTKVKLNSEDKSGSESSARKSEQEIKRYRYTGPPAISLGSWSERPRANVQIKMDTDYKLGVNTSGSKTVVNLNTTSDTNTSVNYTNNYVKTLPKSIKSNAINNYSNDNRKVSVKRTDSQVCSTTSATTGSNSTSTTTTTTTSAISNNNNDSEFKQISSGKLHARTKDEDKPVVTNVELKKSHNDKPEFKVDDDNKIDTRPVNFKELTQTFGQVNLRTKTPKYINNTNRYSDIFDPRSSESVNKNPPKLSTTNGSINPIANGGKKYTSVVDIDTQHLANGFGGQKKFNNTVTKLNGPATAPKGFKIQFNDPGKLNSNSSANFIQKEIVKVNSHVPPPPTMPIITGVTLKNNNNCRKSSRPLSVPGKDPRDQLLESIRGFGRDKLRNVSTVS